MNNKTSSSRNRTLTLQEEERCALLSQLEPMTRPTDPGEMSNRVVNADLFDVLPMLPSNFVDLLIVDPPYNLTKTYNDSTFKATDAESYEIWVESWLPPLLKVLKADASVYICSDWRSSSAIFRVASKYLTIRNRITWEREKGRGALTNWKNSSEDIWFCTASDNYYFSVESVKLKRKVIAPYKLNGAPKDWQEEEHGNFRLTHPSNLWTDITVPFWSMPENTDHPTQKPEKLLAKLILASSRINDMVFDPFGGSGSTAATAHKLGRRYAMIELDQKYCAYALKRLELATVDRSIQGYANGVFWERNTLSLQRTNTKQESTLELSLD